MIKKLNGIIKDVGDFELYCDSCGSKMAECINLKFKDGHKALIYSPLLCETCGQNHNKDIGDDVKRLKQLETLLKNLYPRLINVRAVKVLEIEMSKLGIDWNFKYYNDNKS